MESLNDLMGATPAPVSLSEIIGTQLPSVQPPESAIRNRAATLALATEPDKAMENYQIMVAEGAEGKDDYTKYQHSKVVASMRSQDEKAAMEILASPTATFEQKQAAIQAIKIKPELKDSTHALFTNLASKGSYGETRSTEDARINATVNAIGEIQKQREERQRIVNGYAAGLHSGSGGDEAVRTMAEAAAYWVLPLGMNIAQAREVSGSGAGVYDVLKAFFAPGSSIMEQRKKLEQIPVSERNAAMKNMLENLKNKSGVIFSDNDFQEFAKIQAIAEEEGYSDVDKWIDNAAGLLDIVGVGGALGGALKAAVKSRKAIKAAGEAERTAFREKLSTKPSKPLAEASVQSDMIARVQANAVARQSNPMSPHAVAKQANPEAAANSFEMIYKSEGDAVAEAMAGVSKNDAIADDILPQATTDSGRVTAQPVNIQRNLYKNVPEKIIQYIRSIARSDYTQAERESVRAVVQNDFQQATGMVLHENMGGFSTKFDPKGERIEISAVYGKPDGAWSDAQDAIEQAKLSLRKYGLIEQDIQLLKHDGLDYVPTTLAEVQGKPGSYYIRISMDHLIDPTQVVKLEGVTTKLNFLDSLPGFQGGNSAYLVDRASQIDPLIYRGAVTGTDHVSQLEKLLLEYASSFSDKWAKLDDIGKMKVDEYIIDANMNGVKFDPVDMKYRLGMSDKQIDAVRSWREYWDGQYYLENSDMVRTFNAQGYQLFDDGTDRFFAKPVTKNQNIHAVYDPATRSVKSMSKAEMDALYERGGTYARFRRPIDFNGTVVEHMIVENNAASYTRRLRESDSVLNYREGYFTIHYDKPRFIDKIVTSADGQKIRTTIAVAKDSPEAEAFVKRMQANAQQGETYEHRFDERALRRTSDEWFDIEGARGRIAQRHRGQNLQGADGVNHLGGMEYIESPVSSAVKAAKSIAGRTAMRPVIETAKARLMEQFGHLFRTDAFGQPKWPSSLAEIGEKGKEFSKEVRDARTNWNYINYLENGYINGMDNFMKYWLMHMSEIAGEKGMGKAQRGLLEAAQMGPTQTLKQGAFMAFIAANPLRQALIQFHQSIRAIMYNPKVLYSRELQIDIPAWSWYKTTGNMAQGSKDFIDFIETSGVMSSIDKHSLVRGTLLDAAERRSFVGKALTTPLEISRRAGFDFGEGSNMLVHMAAVFNRYKSAGKNVADPVVREQMHAEVRALTYEMNFAGDMPYNQNSAALLLQFLQVPHKAFLQYTNRNLDKWTKTRLLAGDVIVFGPPIGLITAISQNIFGEDILPEDKRARDLFTQGLEGFVLNYIIEKNTGDVDAGVDWSSLSPYGYEGITKALYALLTGGVEEAFINSPAGSLYFKEGSKVRNALGSALRFMRIAEPVGETPDQFKDVLREVARISSGFSNAEKASMMLEAGKRLNAQGFTIENTNAYEALAQAFGFGSLSQRQIFEFTKARRDVEKEYEKDVISTYKKVMKYATDQMQSGEKDMDRITRATSFMLSKYKNEPEAQRIINQQLARDLKDPTTQVLALIIRTANIPGMEKTVDEIKSLPGISEGDKRKAIEISEQFKKAK